MATPVGTNVINSISRRVLHKQMVDNVYSSVPGMFRALKMNKVVEKGGYQIEAPLVYADFTNTTAFQGFQVLDIAPNDTVKNGAWDWKQYATPVSVDNLSLARADHPNAVADLLLHLFDQAEASLVNKLGTDWWSDATTNTQLLDGMKGAIDDSTVASTYGGLSRASNTWFKSQIDTSTTTMTLAALNTLQMNCTTGGRHPTVCFMTQANYNRYWALVQTNQAFPALPTGADEQLAQGGFSNLLFNNVPVIVDSKVPANHVFFINERYLFFYILEGWNFKMGDFIQPPNQSAYTALIEFYGNPILTNCSRSGKLTALTA